MKKGDVYRNKKNGDSYFIVNHSSIVKIDRKWYSAITYQSTKRLHETDSCFIRESLDFHNKFDKEEDMKEKEIYTEQKTGIDYIVENPKSQAKLNGFWCRAVIYRPLNGWVEDDGFYIRPISDFTSRFEKK
jgi:hypothetical protein